jgi:hypothetical protein
MACKTTKTNVLLRVPPSAPSSFHAMLYGRESRFYIKYLFVAMDDTLSIPPFGTFPKNKCSKSETYPAGSFAESHRRHKILTWRKVSFFPVLFYPSVTHHHLVWC